MDMFEVCGKWFYNYKCLKGKIKYHVFFKFVEKNHKKLAN